LASEVTELFDQALGKMTRRFDLHVAETLKPHQHRIDELIESVRRAAAELFDIPYRAPESSEAFEMKRKPYWVYRKWDPTLPVLIPEEVIDRLLPPGIRKKRLRKRLFSQIESLARYNVENLRWATLQNLDDAFRRFASRLDELLKETVSATHGAIEAAYLKRREHSESIVEDLARLESAMAELTKICEKIHGRSSSDE
jgi:hypothetical protein